VGRRLDAWNELLQAQQFVEKGVALAGPDLLADPALYGGAPLYARVATRLRQHQPAFARLQKALSEAPGSSNGIQQRNRADHARAQMRRALEAMGEAVATYDT